MGPRVLKGTFPKSGQLRSGPRIVFSVRPSVAANHRSGGGGGEGLKKVLFAKIARLSIECRARLLAAAGRWCPEENASFLSRLLFLYVGPLVKMGYLKTLDQVSSVD